MRQLEEANKDLEAKLDKVLEQLALAHTELEANKSSSSEEIERLKQSLKGSQFKYN
jgi:chaperonin cofactor prefoldin